MKAIKISLVVIVGLLISFFAIRSIITSSKPNDIPVVDQNPFVLQINREIELLQNLPNNQFCKKTYDEILYHINDHFRNDKLGITKHENNQQKDNLTKKLYAVYVAKFIQQSFYVFEKADWKSEDLLFIRGEFQRLQNSSFLERGSPVDIKFNEIKTIFNKYDEIVGFVSGVRGFSFFKTELDVRFPSDDVKQKIARADAYRNGKLENRYVNKCSRLHEDLKNVHKSLFNAHVRYLDYKIDQWSGMYPNYNSQKDYLNLLYNPLKGEIDDMIDIPYNLTNVQAEYDRLYNKWSDDNRKAYNYKYKK